MLVYELICHIDFITRSTHTYGMTNASDLSNHFLIAMPSLTDGFFAKSVVYLYEHSAEGAMGIVVNKPLDITLGNVLRHINIEVSSEEAESHPVLMGGPVGQDQGFVIHDGPLSNEQQSKPGIVISASKDTLRAIAKGDTPNHYLVVLGYAGWEKGQLEEEIRRNDWLIAPFEPKILFDTPLAMRWYEAAKLLGININFITDQQGHA